MVQSVIKHVALVSRPDVFPVVLVSLAHYIQCFQVYSYYLQDVYRNKVAALPMVEYFTFAECKMF